jgi:DNA-binding MarR family transcriptional regulator
MKKESFVQEIRLYNRFYVDAIGLLKKGSYYSTYSLTETRVIYEIYQGGSVQASHIMTAIQIDKSYLGRILQKLEKNHLIIRKPSDEDGRASVISLSKKGHQEVDLINKASDQQVNDLIKGLSKEAVGEMVTHMRAIMNIIKTNHGQQSDE